MRKSCFSISYCHMSARAAHLHSQLTKAAYAPGRLYKSTPHPLQHTIFLHSFFEEKNEHRPSCGFCFASKSIALPCMSSALPRSSPSNVVARFWNNAIMSSFLSMEDHRCHRYGGAAARTRLTCGSTKKRASPLQNGGVCCGKSRGSFYVERIENYLFDVFMFCKNY